MAEIEKSMFREYDLRGRVNEQELNEESVQLIGQGFGSMLKRRNVNDCLVAFDARNYSEKIKNALVKGLLSTGINVIDIGMATTPLAYFAQYHFKVKGVAMVTASHNPNGWSGFKLGCDFSSTLLSADLKKLFEIINQDDFEKGQGEVRQENALAAYLADLLGRVKINKKLKVVVNTRNGSASIVMPELLKKAGVEVVEQYCDIDFNYPHGNPNPSEDAMLEELAEKVRETKADLGLAFDGDGDRLGLVDEKGQLIYPDRILLLLSRLVLQKNPGAKIVFDVKCTRALEEDIKEHGGQPVMWKTGHSFIKQKAKDEKAALAGERSGHIFLFENYYGFDDAAMAALSLLEWLSAQEKPLSEIMQQTPQYFSSPVMHAPCPDEAKYKVMEKVLADFKQKFDKVVDVNGARVEFEDGWALVRASSNLPVLVLVFEAESKARLNELEQLIRQELKQFPEVSSNWKNG
jgi:phosphomannomutase/phosphoglucomutase